MSKKRKLDVSVDKISKKHRTDRTDKSFNDNSLNNSRMEASIRSFNASRMSNRNLNQSANDMSFTYKSRQLLNNIDLNDTDKSFTGRSLEELKKQFETKVIENKV